MNNLGKLYRVTLLFLILAWTSIQFGCDLPDDRQKHGQPASSRTSEKDSAPLTFEQLDAKRFLEADALGLHWKYDEFPEKMGRGTVKMATVRSLNEVEFDFPYRGRQRATLQLRIHPKYGKDVTIAIQKGQFLCGFQNCRVSIRFDNAKAQNFSAVEPADHGTTMLFIRGYDRFLASARKAKKVYIEALFYQEGTRVFEFEISGLKW